MLAFEVRDLLPPWTKRPQLSLKIRLYMSKMFELRTFTWLDTQQEPPSTLPTSWRDPKRFGIWHSGWHTWETLLFVIGQKSKTPLPEEKTAIEWKLHMYNILDWLPSQGKKRNFRRKKDIPLGDVWGNGLLRFSLDCWYEDPV